MNHTSYLYIWHSTVVLCSGDLRPCLGRFRLLLSFPSGSPRWLPFCWGATFDRLAFGGGLSLGDFLPWRFCPIYDNREKPDFQAQCLDSYIYHLQLYVHSSFASYGPISEAPLNTCIPLEMFLKGWWIMLNLDTKVERSTQRFDWQMLQVDSGHSKLSVKNSRHSIVLVHINVCALEESSCEWSLQTFMQYPTTDCRAFAAQQPEKLAIVFMSRRFNQQMDQWLH